MTVYYAETFTGRLWSLPLTKPGKPAKVEGFTPGVFVGNFPGLGYFDSLGVEAGAVSVAQLPGRRHHHLLGPAPRKCSISPSPIRW